MWRSVIKAPANGNALSVERVRHTAHNRLRALLVNVPAWKMFEWGGVHNDQWRVNDGARVHQGGRKRVLARLNNPRESTIEHRDCLVGQTRGQDPGGQSFGAHGNGDFKGSMLAGEPGQGAGFSECDFRAILDGARGLGKHHRTECSGGQKDDLPVHQVRCQRRCDVGLCRGRCGAQDQRSPVHGFGNVCRDESQADLVAAAKILESDCSTGGTMRLYCSAIASP